MGRDRPSRSTGDHLRHTNTEARPHRSRTEDSSPRSNRPITRTTQTSAPSTGTEHTAGTSGVPAAGAGTIAEGAEGLGSTGTGKTTEMTPRDVRDGLVRVPVPSLTLDKGVGTATSVGLCTKQGWWFPSRGSTATAGTRNRSEGTR